MWQAVHFLRKCPEVRAGHIMARGADSRSLGCQTRVGPCEGPRRFPGARGKPRATRRPPSPQQPLRDWRPVTHLSLLSGRALQGSVAAAVAEPSAPALDLLCSTPGLTRELSRPCSCPQESDAATDIWGCLGWGTMGSWALLRARKADPGDR